jgi:hypothetical protein
MYDSINVDALPAGAAAYAGYIDGKWPTFAVLMQRFAGAHLLSITVFGNDADCADVETGDMTVADIDGWFRRQQTRKVWRPVIYHSASGMDQVYATMTASGFARADYRLWSAHYGSPLGEHICGPSTCGECQVACDGTQWADAALGRGLDQSLLAADFFGTPTPPPPPAKTSQGDDDMLIQLATTGQRTGPLPVWADASGAHESGGYDAATFTIAGDAGTAVVLTAYWDNGNVNTYPLTCKVNGQVNLGNPPAGVKLLHSIDVKRTDKVAGGLVNVVVSRWASP